MTDGSQRRLRGLVICGGFWGCFLLWVVLVSGCATAPAGVDFSDPWEHGNRKVYHFNEGVDEHVLKPAADAYVKVTPKPVQTSVSKFYNNLVYPNVILNQFLQGHIVLGFSDIGRFLTNTTVGIGGLFDPATHIGLVVHRRDFGQTLAVWGVRQGPYLVLPLVGPSSARDAPDLGTLWATSPLLLVANPYVTVPLVALGIINTRVQATGAMTLVNEGALDRYAFVKNAYLQHREYLIYDGHPPPHMDDEDDVLQ